MSRRDSCSSSRASSSSGRSSPSKRSFGFFPFGGGEYCGVVSPSVPIYNNTHLSSPSLQEQLLTRVRHEKDVATEKRRQELKLHRRPWRISFPKRSSTNRSWGRVVSKPFGDCHGFLLFFFLLLPTNANESHSTNSQLLRRTVSLSLAQWHGYKGPVACNRLCIIPRSLRICCVALH
jgi:hypothetical protein